MKPLIFLDLDDVLCLSKVHHSSRMLKIVLQKIPDDAELWANLVDAAAAENLRQLNDEFTPEYVISSSWATYLSREQMCEGLTRTGLGFVVENLHEEWKTPRALSSTRRIEIEWWLEANQEPGQPYSAIDDTGSGTGLVQSPLAYNGHLVLCEDERGFTRERYDEARLSFWRQCMA